MFFIHDDSGIHDKPGMYQINETEAGRWNADRWGIFMTTNKFSDAFRLENLVSLQNWYLDIDNASDKKEHLLQVIEKTFPLQPTYIVETKNGFHLWYRGTNMTTENYKKIQQGLLFCIKYRGHEGDRLTNMNRVLRVPGFYHWKNPQEPFLVSIVRHTGKTYSEAEMLKAFPNEEKPVARLEVFKKGKDKDWDNELYLKTLSGTPEVRGEVYSFSELYDGRKQIVVNGKTTGNWIDANGKIGSYQGGGPTVLQWLMWYGYTKDQAMSILISKGLELPTYVTRKGVTSL